MWSAPEKEGWLKNRLRLFPQSYTAFYYCFSQIENLGETFFCFGITVIIKIAELLSRRNFQSFQVSRYTPDSKSQTLFDFGPNSPIKNLFTKAYTITQPCFPHVYKHCFWLQNHSAPILTVNSTFPPLTADLHRKHPRQRIYKQKISSETPRISSDTSEIKIHSQINKNIRRKKKSDLPFDQIFSPLFRKKKKKKKKNEMGKNGRRIKKKKKKKDFR